MKSVHLLVIAYPCGGVEPTRVAKYTIFQKSKYKTDPTYYWASRAGLSIWKEIPMQERKCSKCGSTNVYKNTSNNWHKDGLVLQMIAEGGFPDLFQTEAFLCLDCRNLEIQVAGTSTMYGNQKMLIDTIQASNNWVKT